MLHLHTYAVCVRLSNEWNKNPFVWQSRDAAKINRYIIYIAFYSITCRHIFPLRLHHPSPLHLLTFLRFLNFFFIFSSFRFDSFCVWVVGALLLTVFDVDTHICVRRFMAMNSGCKINRKMCTCACDNRRQHELDGSDAGQQGNAVMRSVAVTGSCKYRGDGEQCLRRCRQRRRDTMGIRYTQQ